MSLFKTKELWSVKNPPNETYSVTSLTFYPSTNLIAASNNTDLILSASLEGNLRLFHVVPNDQDVDQETSNASNLLLETNLKAPILQIEVGRLSRYTYSWFKNPNLLLTLEIYFLISVVAKVPS
jgi:hypothetical protein